jgi:hypothetical protein
MDPKLNPPGSDPGGMEREVRVHRITANRLLNLGIQEMIPGSVVWDEVNKSFTADYNKLFVPDEFGAVVKTTDGSETSKDISSGRLSAQLEYENGLPTKATVAYAEGGRVFTIAYKYSPGFCHGQFPVEISRVQDGVTVFNMRLQKLEISKNPLPQAKLDPREAFKGSYDKLITTIYSNGVAYVQDSDSGELKPALTREALKERGLVLTNLNRGAEGGR